MQVGCAQANHFESEHDPTSMLLIIICIWYRVSDLYQSIEEKNDR
jgi:hypothetical protein